MSADRMKQAAIVAIVLLAGGVGGYWLARHQSGSGPVSPAMPDKAAVVRGDKDEKPLYWYDPMKPDQHFDKPGKSPFMDMQLMPKYAEEGADGSGVRINAGVAQNLGIRLATVEQASIAPVIDGVASVQFNERDVAIVQARSGGFVERVYGRAPGDIVAANAPLADVLVPEWLGAQTEFLALARSGDPALVEAGRARLRLTGMPAALIDEVERSGRPRAVTTIGTPIGGVIQSLDVRAGMTLTAGMTLAKVNGLKTVWLEAAVPEAQTGRVAVGQPVEAHFAAYPGESFKGKVVAVLPETNIQSRTLRVRVELANPKGRFKPGMFAQLRIDAGTPRPALFVPSESIIRSGTRNVVIAVREGQRFQPVEVETGQEVAGKTTILKGLVAGQQVVASGQFLIDSEASLRGAVARMDGMAADSTAAAPITAGNQAATLHHGVGKVEALSASDITLSHEAIPSAAWPAMTMTFTLANPSQAKGLKVGDRVGFAFEKGEDSSVIRQLAPPGAQP